MRIKIEGYGVQTFAGIVPFAAYQYFESEGIDLEDYDESLTGDPDDNSLNIPKEYHFAGEYGALNNMADLWEVQGALLDEGNLLTVESDDKPDWECDLSLSTLESHGIKLFEVGDSEDVIYELPSPTAILMGTQVLEGLVFGEEFESNSDFDPKQLEIYYHNHNDGEELIVKSIHYAGQELYNTWLEVDVKSNEYEWIVK